jgi:Rrf2 family iron-sulfur cluster assembly transcriptional regulator
MNLSTRSRYGTRMMVDLAQHYNEGPIQLSSIAKRQDISNKYLEQLIIPLKKANYIRSVRGPKGGYMLTKPPQDITVGEIVRVLEDDVNLSRCIEDPDICHRVDSCLTRDIWEVATGAMYKELNSYTLSEVIKRKQNPSR